jgi:hypothetical protein
MMRKLLAVPVLAIGLSGCLTAGTAPVVTPVTPEVETSPDVYIARIQQATVAACGFLPTANFVADLFLSENQTFETVSAFAKAICGAVVKQARIAKAQRRQPVVAGIVVEGRFVR